jgi:hypothetical protein
VSVIGALAALAGVLLILASIVGLVVAGIERIQRGWADP